MKQSTAKRRPLKPAKPHKDFPLFAHRNGQWAKKVKGKLHYFGSWDAPDKALSEWNRQKDYLLEHGEKKPADGNALTVKRLCDSFLTAKRRRVDSGELSPLTYQDYLAACKFVADEFGRTKLVTNIRPTDFANLRAAFARIHGPHRLGKDVRIVRMLFRFGVENDLISHVVKFGSEFKPPSKTAQKRAKQANGKQHFEAADVRTILSALAGDEVALDRIDARTGEPAKVKPKPHPQLRAMSLLAINTGFGNSDIGLLPLSVVDFDRGWIEYPRVKNAIERRAKLWPETIQAIRDALAVRPKPKDPANDGLVFLTHYGNPWVRLKHADDPADAIRSDAITQTFAKVLKSLGIGVGRRIGFYGLRHSHRTAADASQDVVACAKIMGHSRSGDMGSNYTHRVDDSRLEAVADVVRAWLFPDKVKSEADNAA